MFWSDTFWSSGFWSEGFWSGASVGGAKSARVKRKRIIIDGITRFLTPQETAQVLTARYQNQLETPAIKTESEAHVDIVSAIKGLRASAEFIAKTNAEIERIAYEQKQLNDEDDEECLMLLAA